MPQSDSYWSVPSTCCITSSVNMIKNNDQCLTPLTLLCDRPLIIAITLLIFSENSTWLKLYSPLNTKDSIKTLVRIAPQNHLLMFTPAKEFSVLDRKHTAASYSWLVRDPAKMDTPLRMERFPLREKSTSH